MRSPSALALLAAALLSCTAWGCSFSVHEYQAAGYAPVSMPPGPPRRAERIQADAEQYVVLGVTDNTDYVDQAYGKLLAECPGDIVGVNTRYSTRLSFLSYTNKVEIQAMCLR